MRTKKYIQSLKIETRHTKVQDLDIIAIPTLAKVGLEHTKNILFFEAQGRYTIIHLVDKQIVSSKNLGEYEKRLKGRGFFRVHNSYLINLSKLKQM